MIIEEPNMFKVEINKENNKGIEFKRIFSKGSFTVFCSQEQNRKGE